MCYAICERMAYFMKYEWRKQDKVLYGAKTYPALITIPAQNYIMVSGKGNPNDVDFSNCVGALYSLAYAVKSVFKAASSQEEIHDFAVYPLEGIWAKMDVDYFEKEKLEYTIMIRQPDFIREGVIKEALESVRIKKPNPLLEEINFGAMQNGLCVEILHVGAFDEEPASFEKMDQFSAAHGLRRSESYHREIYLSNANRVEKSKLKTILRYSVEKIPGGSL